MHPCEFKRFDGMWVKIQDCTVAKGTCPRVPNVQLAPDLPTLNPAGEPAFLAEIQAALEDSSFMFQAGDIMTVQCVAAQAGVGTISLTITRGTIKKDLTVPAPVAQEAGTDG
jgi:hypothetical protein